MAEPAAHSQVPAGHPAFPPFEAEHFPSQLAWLAVSFVLLYALMAKVALPRIGAIFAERSKRIGDDLKAAQGFKEQSDTAHSAYEKALADARARAQAIAAETREQQAAAAEATNKRLEAQLPQRLAGAGGTTARAPHPARGHGGAIAKDPAPAIVEPLIGQAPAEHDIAAALGDALKQ